MELTPQSMEGLPLEDKEKRPPFLNQDGLDLISVHDKVDRLHSIEFGKVAIKTIDQVIALCRKHSIWPVTMGLACCAIEMMGAASARYDLARFGMEVFRPSPRQADLMIVSGWVSKKMAPLVRRIYDQMSEPKWVISMGACASCGGMHNSYAVLQGVDQILPVDVYVPGCPPRPEALIYGLMQLQKKIQRTPQAII